MSSGDRSAQQRTVPTFVGPLSVVGVMVGMVAWVAPAFYGGTTDWLIALPVSGVPMLLLPLASVRHLGLGLAASFLVWPFSLIGAVVLPGLLG